MIESQKRTRRLVKARDNRITHLSFPTVFLMLLAFVGFLLVACRPRSARQPQALRYALKGKVISVDKAAKQIVVDHGAIPGFMAAMTMPYSVKHSQMLDHLTSGDQITGEVVVSGDRV